jgi:hypothetical protein
MTEGRQAWLLVGAVFGVLFALLSLVNLVFVDGEPARDLVGIVLGVVASSVAYARYLGWRGWLR